MNNERHPMIFRHIASSKIQWNLCARHIHRFIQGNFGKQNQKQERHPLNVERFDLTITKTQTEDKTTADFLH